MTDMLRLDESTRIEIATRVATWRRVLVACFVLYLPVGMLAGWLSGSDRALLIVFVLTAATVLVFSTKLFLAQCPQCRHPLFVSKEGFKKMHSSHCLTCGLSLSTSVPATTPKASSLVEGRVDK